MANSNVVALPAPSVKIGSCIGCSEHSRLIRYVDRYEEKDEHGEPKAREEEHEDACEVCVRSEKRGVAWLRLARKVRSDPKFARSCFQQMRTQEMRDQFVLRFGTPWVRAC